MFRLATFQREMHPVVAAALILHEETKRVSR
jgi:hypothetical protein